MKKKLDGKIKQPLEECKKRLQMEFAVFEKTGVIDYLLLLADIFLWCDKVGVPGGPAEKIMRGTARGSAAGSFALYLIGLTKINPFRHDLNFTRFLSEARAKPKWIDGIMYCDGKTMADFDGDISFLGRPKVIERLERDYAGKTCKISTLQYLTGKMALKDTLKIYCRYTETDAKMVSDLVEAKFGKVRSLHETYHGNGKPKDDPDYYAGSDEFRKWADANPKAFKIAMGIEGLIRTSGIHASGMLISYYPILDLMPMQLSDSGEIVSAYPMDIALQVFVKADLLGLRTLDIVEACVKEINETFKPSPPLDIDDVDIDDPAIYQYYTDSSRYLGLFQIEAGLTKQVVKRVKPKHVDQLAACLSISRPGAFIYIDDYVKFVTTGEFKKINSKIDEILIQTGGLILYQEQINRICQEVYGMSAVDADEVRRAIGKKLKSDMAVWEPVLYKNGDALGIPKDTTKWFWDTCNASADYLFNANHCYGYSYITAQYTTWLKAKYPLQWFLGMLKLAQYEAKPLQVIHAIQKEMGEFGFKLQPPNIYRSQADYSIANGEILTGLTAVKGVSDKALEKLRLFKGDNTNKFKLFESIQQAKLPVNIMTALIMSGCMDTFGVSRSRLVLELETYGLLTAREIPLVHRLGEDFKWDLCEIVNAMGTRLKDEKGKPLIKETRLATIRRDYDDYWEKFVHNSKHEKLCCYIMETEYLGFPYSTSLLDIYKEFCNDLSNVHEVETEVDNTKVRLAVRALEVENKISRAKRTPYLRILAGDETGEMIMMCFGEERIGEIKAFNAKELQEGDIIIVNGRKKGDVVFIDSLSIQENPVIIKKSDLKKLQPAAAQPVT